MVRVSIPWTSLRTPVAELRLEHTLENGQCFGWSRRTADVWVGVLGARVLELRQTESDCLFRCVGPPQDAVSAAAAEDVREELEEYFQLGEELAPLYSRWAAADERMARVANVLPGMRIIRQVRTHLLPAQCWRMCVCACVCVGAHLPRAVFSFL